MTRDRILIALPIFLGAFLLFAVESLIAKMILPWFGGAASVWLACLLFFQGALLAGYAYAHLLTSRVAIATQWKVHLVLVALSLAVLPIIPADSLKPDGTGSPLLQILILLTATIGLPFLLLSATGPLMQTWFARRESPETAPAVYRLFALSNFASLLALVSYPTVIEPLLPTHVQAWAWSVAYGLYAVSVAVAAWHYGRGEAREAAGEIAPDDITTVADRLFWLVLAAAPSILLLAVTNYMLRNIAAIPMLWIVPLSLYLLSFIIAFDHPRWYYRPLWYLLLPVAIGGMIFSIAKPFYFDSYLPQLALYSSAFFVYCMVCHGELASQKPRAAHLTSFYLIIGCGGAIGGLAITVAAPLIFNRDLDLTISLALFVFVVSSVAWRRWPANTTWRWVRWLGLLTAPAAWPVLVWILAQPAEAWGINIELAVRNFYGPLNVTTRRMNAAGDIVMELQNGNIMHGRQHTAKDKKCEPLSYYARSSGVGLAIKELAAEGNLKIGVIGLGAGTIAAYARADDSVRFYEINPLVRNIAANVFSYMDCTKNTAVAMGDARLALEREPANAFDLLAVDAFSSDAIPVHLLTAEAFDLYWRHIKPSGVLAVHVSNRFIDLVPIVAAAAARSGKTARLLADDADEGVGGSRSDWVLVTDRADLFERPALSAAQDIGMGIGRLWTDDYSNLWQILGLSGESGK